MSVQYQIRNFYVEKDLLLTYLGGRIHPGSWSHFSMRSLRIETCDNHAPANSTPTLSLIPSPKKKFHISGWMEKNFGYQINVEQVVYRIFRVLCFVALCRENMGYNWTKPYPALTLLPLPNYRIFCRLSGVYPEYVPIQLRRPLHPALPPTSCAVMCRLNRAKDTTTEK